MITLLQACNQTSEQLPEHLRAEPLIDSSPDSALTLLAGIDSSHLDKPFHRANHAVLTVLARYRAGIDDTSISLLEPAIDFYARDSRPCRYAMLTHFLKGIILYNNKHYSEAIIEFMDAENLADELNDFRYLGLARRNISDIYGTSYCITEQYEYSLKALEAFKRQPQKSYLAQAYSDVALALQGLIRNEESIKYTDSSITINREVGNPFIEVTNELSLARNNIVLKNESIALTHYSNAIKIDSSELIKYDYSYMAKALGKISTKIDNDTYSTIKRHLDKARSGITHTVDYLTKHGNYKEAYLIISKENEDAWHRLGDVRKQSTSFSVMNYKERQIQKAQNTIHYHRIIQTILIIAAIVLLGLSALVFYVQYKYNRMRRKELSYKVLSLIDEIQALQNCNSKFTGIIQKHFKHSYHTINEFLETSAEECEHQRLNKRLLSVISKSMADLTTNKTIAKIEDDLNEIDNDIVKLLRDEVADISDNDVRLFIYFKIGLSSRAISVLEKSSIENIYRKKYIIKQKIKRSQSMHTERLLSSLDK